LSASRMGSGVGDLLASGAVIKGAMGLRIKRRIV